MHIAVKNFADFLDVSSNEGVNRTPSDKRKTKYNKKRDTFISETVLFGVCMNEARKAAGSASQAAKYA